MTGREMQVAMRKVPLHWEELEIAFERNGPDSESFLDLVTGSVLTLMEGAPDARELAAQIAGRASSFQRIEPASSREQYRWMERFVGAVADGPLRDRLILSIDGKGAFRRFKDVLLNFPVERERWFSYRADLLHYHMQQWLADHQIESTVPPPWGVVATPAELPAPMPRPLPAGDGPGEVSRRQARELIEGLAPLDLPAAVAFLTFLKERGAGALTPSPGRHGSSVIASDGLVDHDALDDSDDDPDAADDEDDENGNLITRVPIAAAK